MTDLVPISFTEVSSFVFLFDATMCHLLHCPGRARSPSPTSKKKQEAVQWRFHWVESSYPKRRRKNHIIHQHGDDYDDFWSLFGGWGFEVPRRPSMRPKSRKRQGSRRNAAWLQLKSQLGNGSLYDVIISAVCVAMMNWC